MKKHEAFPLMDSHDNKSKQLSAVLELLLLAGTKLNSDAHAACISLCAELDAAKNNHYQCLRNAIMGEGD